MSDAKVRPDAAVRPARVGQGLRKQRAGLKRFWTTRRALPGKPAWPNRAFIPDFYGFMNLRSFSRFALAALFVLAGSWHFAHPAPYLRIMAPQLPHPLALVYVSGAAEVLGGLGLLPARTRRLAGWGLLALLLAVFPANLYMALAHAQLGIPGWVAWGRLPLQLPLLWWTWRVMRQP